MAENLKTLTPIETDALQEIMNIGFGRAAADLAEIINLHVILSIPHIAILEADDVISHVQQEIPDISDMSMITQFFSGKFNGGSFLVFPHGEGRKLLSVFDPEITQNTGQYDLDLLEKETLVEIGNIIIGACVGKIAEMLGDVVTYAPPRFFSHDQIYHTLEGILEDSDSFAILFKTVFNFEHDNVNGYLFLVSQYSIMPWLKRAIADFLGPYE